MLKWNCLLMLLLNFSGLHIAIYADDSPPFKESSMRGTGKEEIAMLDRKDLYRRYENKNDWDYRQNWQVDRNAYLRGEQVFEGPQRDYIYPSGTTQYPYQYKDNTNYYYDNTYPYNNNVYYPQMSWGATNSAYYDEGVYYTKPRREDNSSNNTDYRQNWQNNPQSYLRGQYNEQHPYSGYNYYPMGSASYDEGVYYTKPRREDNSSNNTDYRQNWQNNPQIYLKGQYNEQHPYSGYNYYPKGYSSYDEGVYYTKPKREDNSSNNTDYRQNWQNNPRSYLRGDYNEQHPKSGYGSIYPYPYPNSYPSYNTPRYNSNVPAQQNNIAAKSQYNTNGVAQNNRVQPASNTSNHNESTVAKNEANKSSKPNSADQQNKDNQNKQLANQIAEADTNIKLHSHKSWDYRQNWRYHRKVYLKGEYQRKFENKLIAEARKKNNKSRLNRTSNVQ